MQNALQQALVVSGLSRPDGRMGVKTVSVVVPEGSGMLLCFGIRAVDISAGMQVLVRQRGPGTPSAEVPVKIRSSQVDGERLLGVAAVRSMNVVSCPGVGYRLYVNFDRRCPGDRYADAWMEGEYGTLLRKLLAHTWWSGVVRQNGESPRPSIFFRDGWTTEEPDTILTFE